MVLKIHEYVRVSLHTEQGGKIWSQVVTGDTFTASWEPTYSALVIGRRRMHVRSRCEQDISVEE